MIRALALAFGQLDDPPVRRVLLYTVLITLMIAGALIGIVAGLLSAFDVSGLGWLDNLIALFGGLAAALIAWMLFPAIATQVIFLFLETIADAVEARHYPQLARARPVSVWSSTLAGIRLGIVMLLANILILPISFIPGLNLVQPVIYYAINGALIGREYSEVVGPRRMTFRETHILRRRHRFKIFVSGIVIALLFTIPVLNLIAPVIATAFMVHVLHGLEPNAAAVARQGGGARTLEPTES
jgi:uncharacterized protein involved in cysteine biosynthesis